MKSAIFRAAQKIFDNSNGKHELLAEKTVDGQLNIIDSIKFNELKNLDEEDIIIYGQSLKEQDNHLVELIDNKFKNVYISIKIFENSTYGTLRSEISKIQSRFRKSNLFFFNSETLFDFN